MVPVKISLAQINKALSSHSIKKVVEEKIIWLLNLKINMTLRIITLFKELLMEIMQLQPLLILKTIENAEVKKFREFLWP